MNTITIGGTTKFTNFDLGFKEIDRILTERKIDKTDLTVYGYEDDFKVAGAYIVAQKWAENNNVSFANGQVPFGKGDFKLRKDTRDTNLASRSALLINLRCGQSNGGLGTIEVFEKLGVPVEIVDEAEATPSTAELTPVERRKGDVPSIEDVTHSVKIYSEVAKKLLTVGALMLDTETTGKDSKDEVIDIALGDCASGKILYQSFIKVEAPMHPKATEVNKVTQEMLDERCEVSPTLGEVWDEIESVVGDRIVLCSHNTNGTQNFDEQMLNQSLKKFGKTCSFIWMNIQTLYRMYSCQRAEGKYPLRTDGICLQLGIKKGTHEAKADVLAQMKILKAMAKGVIPDFTV